MTREEFEANLEEARKILKKCYRFKDEVKIGGTRHKIKLCKKYRGTWEDGVKVALDTIDDIHICIEGPGPKYIEGKENKRKALKIYREMAEKYNVNEEDIYRWKFLIGENKVTRNG